MKVLSIAVLALIGAEGRRINKVHPRRLDTNLLRFIDDGGDDLEDQTAYTAYNSWTDDEVDMGDNYIK